MRRGKATLRGRIRQSVYLGGSDKWEESDDDLEPGEPKAKVASELGALGKIPFDVLQ